MIKQKGVRGGGGERGKERIKEKRRNKNGLRVNKRQNGRDKNKIGQSEKGKDRRVVRKTHTGRPGGAGWK